MCMDKFIFMVFESLGAKAYPLQERLWHLSYVFSTLLERRTQRREPHGWTLAYDIMFYNCTSIVEELSRDRSFQTTAMFTTKGRGNNDGWKCSSIAEILQGAEDVLTGALTGRTVAAYAGIIHVVSVNVVFEK